MGKKTGSTGARIGSFGLIVPQYFLAGLSVLLGGAEIVVRTGADGLGVASKKCYAGEQAIAKYRLYLDGDLERLQALNDQVVNEPA